MADHTPLLSVDHLKTHFFTPRGVVPAVDGVSLTVNRGETLALVGESGCGKSVLSLSILRLVPDPPGRIVEGRVDFDGTDLLRLPEKEMRTIRGGRISMIFQEPMTALNPVFTIGAQLEEMLRLHRRADAPTTRARRELAAALLNQVGIPRPARRLRDYPHQLSGGMCQRVMIAMSLGSRPELMIADEPTTALDVTTQAQILALMNTMQQETGAAIILVTHDLGVVAQTCSRVAVMYTGKVVEHSPTEALFRNPLHPYTRGLLASVPRLGPEIHGRRLAAIPGSVPGPGEMPAGCAFHDRCPVRMDICPREYPPVFTPEPGHTVRCWRYAP